MTWGFQIYLSIHIVFKILIENKTAGQKSHIYFTVFYKKFLEKLSPEIRLPYNIYTCTLSTQKIYTVVSTVHRGDVRSQNLRSVEQIKMALPYC
jgi:hypothetical protein